MKNTLLAATALLLELLHAPHTTGTAGVTSIFLNRTGIFKAPHLPQRSPQSYFSASALGINLIWSAHTMQYKQDSHSQGPFTSRACHVPKLAACLEGFFWRGFKPYKWNFREVWKCASRASNIHTLVLLPPAISACCISQQKWELWITIHTSNYSAGRQWEWVGSSGRCPHGLTAPLKF